MRTGLSVFSQDEISEMLDPAERLGELSLREPGVGPLLLAQPLEAAGERPRRD